DRKEAPAMAQRISELMASPITIQATASLADAARTMRDANIGDVVVADGHRPLGVLTDRDIVVLAVAEGRVPERTAASELCSGEVVTVGPEEDVLLAVRTMREKAVRRVPVVADGRLVGVVSLGDLATERDVMSALAHMSAADPSF